jgi:hypothetical protein
VTKQSGTATPSIIRQTRSSEEFVAYCEGEFDRRMNSGDEFDEEGFREAMNIALAKLRNLEEGA